MNSNELISFLRNKGVNHLYHANTVVTAITFLNHGGLMSRKMVEENGLLQTPQESDDHDKLMGVYGDVFFDSVDIHERIKNINYYGAVLFVYDVNVLTNRHFKITRENPKGWKENYSDDEKYLNSDEAIEGEFVKGDFGQEITVCDLTEAIPFDCLEKIIIDKPPDECGKLLENAKKEIEEAARKNGIQCGIEVRSCPENCQCKGIQRGHWYHRLKTVI